MWVLYRQRRLDKVSYIIEEFLELGNKTWPVSLCSEEMSVPREKINHGIPLSSFTYMECDGIL